MVTSRSARWIKYHSLFHAKLLNRHWKVTFVASQSELTVQVTATLKNSHGIENIYVWVKVK